MKIQVERENNSDAEIWTLHILSSAMKVDDMNRVLYLGRIVVENHEYHFSPTEMGISLSAPKLAGIAQVMQVLDTLIRDWSAEADGPIEDFIVEVRHATEKTTLPFCFRTIWPE